MNAIRYAIGAGFLLVFVAASFGQSFASQDANLARGDGPQATNSFAEQLTPERLRQIPIVVHSRSDTDPLTEDQLHTIVEHAITKAGTQHQIWFIALKRNHLDAVRCVFTADVYFVPETQTPRVRKGRVVSFDSTVSEAFDALRTYLAQINPDDATYSDREVPSYIQVSSVDKPFGDVRTLPSGPLMPFNPPDEFTDDEVVELIDFVRSLPKSHPEIRQDNGIHIPWDEFDGQWPIVRIDRGDGQITVMTGHLDGMLSGGGRMITLVKEDGDYQIIGVGSWYS